MALCARRHRHLEQVEEMMVQINADKEEAEAVRVKVEAEEAVANEKVRGLSCRACLLYPLYLHTIMFDALLS